jgi:hypothetical protein
MSQFVKLYLPVEQDKSRALTQNMRISAVQALHAFKLHNYWRGVSFVFPKELLTIYVKELNRYAARADDDT